MLAVDRPITDLGPDFDRRWRRASQAFRRELMTEIRSIYQMLEEADIPVLGTGSAVTMTASSAPTVAKKPAAPLQNSLFGGNDASNAPSNDNPFLPQSIRDRLQHSHAQTPVPLASLTPVLKQAQHNTEQSGTDAAELEATLRLRLGPVIDNLIESHIDALRSELRVRLRAEMDQLIAEHLRK
jgi:hypothetical protein